MPQSLVDFKNNGKPLIFVVFLFCFVFKPSSVFCYQCDLQKVLLILNLSFCMCQVGIIPTEQYFYKNYIHVYCLYIIILIIIKLWIYKYIIIFLYCLEKHRYSWCSIKFSLPFFRVSLSSLHVCSFIAFLFVWAPQFCLFSTSPSFTYSVWPWKENLSPQAQHSQSLRTSAVFAHL